MAHGLNSLSVRMRMDGWMDDDVCVWLDDSHRRSSSSSSSGQRYYLLVPVKTNYANYHYYYNYYNYCRVVILDLSVISVAGLTRERVFARSLARSRGKSVTWSPIQLPRVSLPLAPAYPLVPYPTYSSHRPTRETTSTHYSLLVSSSRHPTLLPCSPAGWLFPLVPG